MAAANGIAPAKKNAASDALIVSNPASIPSAATTIAGASASPQARATRPDCIRTIAALAVAPDLMERSGTIQWCEDVSREFDVRDEFGNVLSTYGRRLTT